MTFSDMAWWQNELLEDCRHELVLPLDGLGRAMCWTEGRSGSTCCTKRPGRSMWWTEGIYRGIH